MILASHMPENPKVLWHNLFSRDNKNMVSFLWEMLACTAVQNVGHIGEFIGVFAGSVPHKLTQRPVKTNDTRYQDLLS